jgi:NAD+ kinase
MISLIPKSDQKEIYLTQDGQLGYELMVKDRIDISLAEDKNVLTIELPEDNYFDLLREKLQWGNMRIRQTEEE